MLSGASRHVFCLITLFSPVMCFIALSWHIFSGVFFLCTDRLVILATPVFHTSYICPVSLLAPAGIEWTSYLPWTDRLGSVFWAGVRAQTRFVRYFRHLMEGGQLPCNPQKKKKKKKKLLLADSPCITFVSHVCHQIACIVRRL